MTDEPNHGRGRAEGRGGDSQPRDATRYATVALDLERTGLPPETGTELPAGVRRDRIDRFNVVDDETIVMLSHLRGDLDRARRALADAPNVIAWDVVGLETGYAYVHCELGEPVGSLLSALSASEVVLDVPIEFAADGRVHATLVGDAESLERALDAVADVVDVRLLETGEYRPGARELASLLTDRQYRVLSIAVDRGYYEVPRRATLAEVAEAAGLSQSTVGEHLQKAEARVLSRIVR
ncbi:helix-turn-helix domain-containing protein [Halomarina pelagica]|uniref:helix-turn-helix domain-containing protein n=1 Tax=Halomarina pelagica TaxID=2961599 RepID=UPI0020C31296|nr:helix-turn-helix domain-containing protein [Halomarina sp. BND7]